ARCGGAGDHRGSARNRRCARCDRGCGREPLPRRVPPPPRGPPGRHRSRVPCYCRWALCSLGHLVALENLDDARFARAEAVELRGAVRAVAALLTGWFDEVERVDLLAEVALVERAPEDDLVDALQLGQREGVGQQTVDDVGVL